MKKIVKISHYLAKIWAKYDSLVFLGHPVYRQELRVCGLQETPSNMPIKSVRVTLYR